MVELDRELARFEKLPEPDEAEAARLAGWIFDEKRIEAFVAELDDRIEGMAIFWEGLGSSFRARPFLFLEDLVVSEAARSRGVGEALVAAVAREGVSRKVMRIDWVVLDWNERAMRFYRRIGARPVTEWVRYTLEDGAMRRLAAGSGAPDPVRSAEGQIPKRRRRARGPGHRVAATRSARPRGL
jgi:GNAT superfamily N-acetyltransferase